MSKYKKIDSFNWFLIMIGLFCLLMPMIKVIYVLPDYINFYFKGYFDPFVNNSSDYFHPFWKCFLIFKFSLHSFLVFFWLGTAILFIKKNTSFPKCFIIVVTLNTILFLLSSYVSTQLTNNENLYYFYPILEIELHEWYPTLGLVIFFAPYVLLSIRSKAIFVNSFSEESNTNANVLNLANSYFVNSHPIFEAIHNRKLPHVMYYLQELKDKNICDSQGRPLLHAVVGGSMPGVLRLLVESKIDINVKDKDGNTPLHVAISTKNINLVLIKILIKAGADLNIKNKFNEAPIDQLARVENSVYTEILKYIELNNNKSNKLLNTDSLKLAG